MYNKLDVINVLKYADKYFIESLCIVIIVSQRIIIKIIIKVVSEHENKIRNLK